LLFNECINNRDIEGLVRLMADNYTLIAKGHVDARDRETGKQAWSAFFRAFPDYRNIFTRIESVEDFVAIAGNSTCSNDSLNGPALWSARVVDDLVAEWQVYEDNGFNRNKLGLT
jgi:ketosteroid isomerase-like protein